MRFTTGNKLQEIQGLYEVAKRKWVNGKDGDSELDKYWEQYNGGHTITRTDGTQDKVNYVRNITFELIESQISSSVLFANIKPFMHSKSNQELAKVLEHYINTQIDRLPFEEYNDLDERLTYIFGGSVWLIEWDDSITTHNTKGGYKITILDPRRIVPQPNVYKVRDMEYCFIEFYDTLENVKRKYGIDDLEGKVSNDDDTSDEDTCTLIVCFYRDDKGRVCRYTYANDIELEDIEDYWGRKDVKCGKCGGTKDTCTCTNPDFKTDNLEYEEIDEEMVFFNGLKVISPLSPVVKDGQLVYEEKEMPKIDPMTGQAVFQMVAGSPMPITEMVKVPKTEKTKVPFYKPTLFPIVIRKNISVPNKLLGQSDCEFIRDQQQTINKLESRINEKSINSGVAVTRGEDTRFEVNSEIFKTGIELKSPEQAAMIKILDFRVDTSQDEARSESVYNQAKRIVGISDSFQGQEDRSAESGYAKQIQVQQSAGRLQSKRTMKKVAYQEIFEVMFQLALAYADEPRPISYKEPLQGYIGEEFNKYAFLERDSAGEWYYNDEFVFSASETDYESNRLAMWQETTNNFRSGSFGNPADIETLIYYWRMLDELHYPMADKVADRFEQQRQQMIEKANAQAQAVIQQAKTMRNPQANQGLATASKEGQPNGK
jgi:hypothetical protein